MFVKSSLLLWAVIQVLILGSQTMPQPTPSKFADCPPPWFNIENQCFRVVTEKMHNRDAARTHCQAQAQCGGGDLAQPRNVTALAEYITNNKDYPSGANDTYWLGSSDLAHEQEWRWINNSTITDATGWGPRQPNDDYSWTTTNHFICERNLCDCPMPWFRVGLECFLRVGFLEGARNWASARTYCGEQASGADLAQPNDIKALADYLTENGYDRNYYHYWVGGSDLATEGDWCWINGTEVNINRKFESSNADCLTMWIGRGSDTVQLYDRECDVKWPFICERH